MDNKYLDCGYYFLNGTQYIIKIDKDLKKHYYSLDDNRKIDLSVQEELDKIFNPNLFDSLPKRKDPTCIDEEVTKKYEGYILDFTKKMKPIFSMHGIDVKEKMNERLANLTIVDSESSTFEVETVKGKYDPLYNVLYINPKLEGSKVPTISHELFHAITTDRTDKSDIKVGFYSTKTNIGIGLTEYSTKYFIGRFIGGRSDTFDDFDIELMEKLLSITGYQLFLKYIIENDLNSLIQYLSKYISFDEAIRLIFLIDNYYYTVRSFRETNILRDIKKLLSSGVPIAELYSLIDKKAQLNACKDKYEESIVKILEKIRKICENNIALKSEKKL